MSQLWHRKVTEKHGDYTTIKSYLSFSHHKIIVACINGESYIQVLGFGVFCCLLFDRAGLFMADVLINIVDDFLKNHTIFDLRDTMLREHYGYRIIKTDVMDLILEEGFTI